MPQSQVLLNQGLANEIHKSYATFTGLLQALHGRMSIFDFIFYIQMYGGSLACSKCMRLDFVVCLSILLAVLFIGTTGAFFLYVPGLALLTTVTLILGLSLMYVLGLITGSRWRRWSLFQHRSTPKLSAIR